jgi:hypothetical protein
LLRHPGEQDEPIRKGQEVVRFFIAAMGQYPAVRPEPGDQVLGGSAYGMTVRWCRRFWFCGPVISWSLPFAVHVLFFGFGAAVKRGEQTKDKPQCRRQHQQEDDRHLNGNKQEMGLDRASVLYDHNHKRTNDY